MADKGRYNLTINERGPSANFFGQHDLFEYDRWITTKNYVIEPFDITPINTTHTRGSTTTFELDKRGDELGALELRYTRAAITGGTTYQRFVDWEAPFSVEVVRFYYGNKLMHEIYGEKIYLEQTKEDKLEKRTRNATLQLGDLSVADRNTTAASSCTLTLDLRAPWAHPKKHIKFVGLPNKIRVEVTWARLLNVIQSDAVGSVTGGDISSPVLRCQYYHLKQNDRNRVFQQLQAKEGLVFKYLSHEYHRREPVLSAATSARIRLRNIKNDVVYLTFVMRSQNDVDGTNSPGADPTDLLEISTIRIQENGTDVTETYDFSHTQTAPSYHLYDLGFRTWPNGVQGNRIYTIPFCLPEKTMMSRDHCYGSRAIGKYNNPEAVITFSAPGVDCYIDIWADIHNLFLQRQGDMKRFLA